MGLSNCVFLCGISGGGIRPSCGLHALMLLVFHHTFRNLIFMLQVLRKSSKGERLLNKCKTQLGR